MKKKIKVIGKNSEKIGGTTVSGEGTTVDYPDNSPETVAVRDYVASKGYSGIVNWDGKNPTVAGEKITPTEIRNGISYAKKSDMDAVLGNLEKRAGIKSDSELRNDKYEKAKDKAFDAVVNREKFDYDPEKDVVYNAYKKQYEREADHALRRILNANNTSVTGASSAVLSEAMAARDNELRKITDVIPELYEAAYNRYINEGKRLNSNLDTINGLANDYYDRAYRANTDIINRMNEAGNREREERQRQLDNERNDRNDYYDNALDAIELMYKEDSIKSDLNKDKASLEKTAMDNALSRGFFIEADEAAMPWLKNYKNSDGTYTILPNVAMLAYEYDATHARERAKLNAKRGVR